MNILYNEGKTLFKILRKREYLFFLRYFFGGILRFFYKKPVGLFVTPLGGYMFTLPLYQPINWMLSEIFIYETLHHIKGGKNVLDLGGFVGESALYLAKHNEHIDVYELDPQHFAYLEKNCHQKDTISMFPRGVGDSDKTIYIEKSGIFDPAGHANNEGGKGVEGHIKSIQNLALDTYDSIKIDIEGAEFEILPYIIKNNFFSLKNGFIEFHFTSGTQANTQKDIFHKTILSLKGKGYTIWCIDNYNNHISENLRDSTPFLSLCFTT